MHPRRHENNLYLLGLLLSTIGKLDGQDRQVTAYRGAIPSSRPRRGRVDEQNRLWFRYAATPSGMLDPKTEQVQEWSCRRPGTAYDVVTDKNGEAWTGSMLSDRVSRLDPKTGTSSNI